MVVMVLLIVTTLVVIIIVIIISTMSSSTAITTTITISFVLFAFTVSPSNETQQDLRKRTKEWNQSH